MKDTMSHVESECKATISKFGYLLCSSLYLSIWSLHGIKSDKKANFYILFLQGQRNEWHH